MNSTTTPTSKSTEQALEVIKRLEAAIEQAGRQESFLKGQISEILKSLKERYTITSIDQIDEILDKCLQGSQTASTKLEQLLTKNQKHIDRIINGPSNLTE
jgi:hypothetical protein